jgi:glyoxylase-like metal-dependent hydrolase (beta-lactamase superfamily II)
MPPIGANATKTANAQVNPSHTLGWDLFVTPGIPIVTVDLSPGVRQAYFRAMASTLIYGARDAVLVVAFMTVKQANALANWIAAKGKNLTSIYITHGHGDHWFGVGTLLERFPNARAVATPDVVKVMRQNASPEFLDKVWKAAFPGQIPDKLVVAEELKGNVIDLEGQDLVAVELGHTDTDYTTCLNVPSIELVVAGDAAYNDVHLDLAESNAQKRREWVDALDKIESATPEGTHVRTEESWEGVPLPAQAKGIQDALDASLVRWLSFLKTRSEAPAAHLR